MARILGVGIATVDIINTVDGYPPEDAEVRALSQRIARGGNAANSLVVLSQLGHHCSWAGVLADEPNTERIVSDLRHYGVDLSHCQRFSAGKVPVSYITLNARTGSRTIVHYRDLPELSFEAFASMELDGYDWIHFEGRNVEQTARMMHDARVRAPSATISLEVEKPRSGIETLMPHAHVMLFARAYAQALGFPEPRSFLQAMAEKAPERELVCGWGEQGAHVRDRGGELFRVPAYPPSHVVDTLGAGDTFNAGIIHGRLRGRSWPATLESAARLAGRKCARQGLDGLEE